MMDTMSTTPLKILFVEDSEVDVELALRKIQKEGFDVSWTRVETEDDLRHSLQTSKPQLILSDFTMPRFNGVEALRIANETAPDIPFIFLSGTIGEERAIDAIQMGATDYVLKGNSKRLVTAIRRALTDVEERNRARVVEEEKQRMVAVLEATSDLVAIAEPEGKIIYLNAAGRKLIGAPETGSVGMLASETLPSWVNALMESEGRPAAIRDGSWQGETAIIGGDGTEIPVSQVMIAHRGADNEPLLFSTIARDIRERKAYEARLQHFANYDALTGLPNRNLLADRAAQAIAHARRADQPVTLLVLGLDRFAWVNDGYGHGVGDKLLCMVAERLQAVVRDGDTAAHLGADSFAVLAIDRRADQVFGMVRQIRQAMREAFVFDGFELNCSVGIGVSTYPRDGDDFEILLRNADAAMHRARSGGHGGFQFYAETMTREAILRVELEQNLMRAMEKKDLLLHFQPQIDLMTGRLVGVEALMRWHHEGREWIPPAQFIPIAEDSELICALGEFALLEAFRQIAVWDGEGVAPLRVAVNVSARQFRDPRFLDVVSGALKNAALDPGRLEIELTESVLVGDQDAVIAILKRLKNLGVQVAVDDFGTGYSSLSYLSRLPIDRLKIDRSFVMRINEHGHDATIAQAIISLAHSLGLKVIAEGIETSEQYDFLRSRECDEGQGYLFSKPLAAEAVLPLVAAGFLGRAPAEGKTGPEK